MRPLRFLLPLVLVVLSCSSDRAADVGGPSSTSSVSDGTIMGTEGVTSVTTAVATSTATTAVATSTEPTVPLPVFDASLLPAPPAAAVLGGTDPAGRALELVAATADDAPDSNGGWLATYAELGVPVIDATGVSSLPGDQIGPKWESVWAIGTMSRGSSTIPLTDAARVLGWDGDNPADPIALLADIRDAAVSTNPVVQTLGLFIAGKSTANGGADPRDATVVAEQVSMDAATLQLVEWVTARESLFAAAAPDLGAATATSPTDGAARPVHSRAAAAPCSEVFGSSDQTSWINSLIGKLGGGVGIEGVKSLPGLVELWIGKINAASKGADAGEAAAAKAALAINALNVSASLLSLIAQVNAMELGTKETPDPLVRHREASDGETADVTIELSFNSERFDGNDASFCLLSLIANALGVGLSLPPNGAPLSGVEVIITAGHNFPDKVYFQKATDGKGVTDAAGQLVFGVQGRARPKTLPESAKEFIDEYSLNYAAQVEAETGQSILNVFIDGLSLHKGAPGGAVDIAKTLHYDLGEYTYQFKDYLNGFRVDQVWIGGYNLTGEVCDLDKPFTLAADGSGVGGYTGQLTITPGAAGAVTYSMVGTFQTLPGHGEGAGYITVTSERALVYLDGGSFVATFPRGLGDLPVGPGGAHFQGADADPILLVSDPTTCGGTGE